MSTTWHGDDQRRRRPRPPRRGRTALATVLLAAVTATGCTGPRPGDSQRAPVPMPAVDTGDLATEPAPVEPTAAATPPDQSLSRDPAATYTSYLDALQRRDAEEACRLQHPLRTIELRYEAVLVDRAELGDPCVGFEALLWEDPLRSFDPVEVETTRDTGEKATLAVGFAESSPTTRVTVELVFQRAAWRVRSEGRRGGGVGDTGRWVGAWCDLSTDDSRAEVVEAMGTPSGEYTVSDGGEPQLYWASDQYDFRVYLDPVTDAVLDLVGDYDALSSADRDRLTCPELR